MLPWKGEGKEVEMCFSCTGVFCCQDIHGNGLQLLSLAMLNLICLPLAKSKKNNQGLPWWHSG